MPLITKMANPTQCADSLSSIVLASNICNAASKTIMLPVAMVDYDCLKEIQ